MSLLGNNTYANPNVPFWVDKVVAGTGVSVTGTETEPIISSTGLLSLSAEDGIAINGDPQNPTISNTGVLTVEAGTGISVIGGQNPQINNDGILSVSAGTSIAIGGTLQNPIISNPDFFRNNYTNNYSTLTQSVTTEIQLFTENFILNPNTTYIHTFSYNNFSSAILPGTTNYSVISRILPQGVIYPGVVSNLLITGANDVWSRGIMQPFTTTNATNYTFQLRVVVGAGTLNLRNIQTKVYRVS